MNAPFTCEEVGRAFFGPPVDQHGDELSYHCPHSEKHANGDAHPSLKINVEKDKWGCFVCNAGGKAWKLAAFILGVDPNDKTKVEEGLRAHGLLHGSRSASSSAGEQQGQRRVAEFALGRDQNAVEVRKVRLEPGSEGRSKDFHLEHRLRGERWKKCYNCHHQLKLYTNKAFRELRDAGRLTGALGLEGEGKVDQAGELGIPAFSHKGLTAEQSSELRGLDPILWPDRDLSGTKQANDAGKLLRDSGQVKRIGLITPPAELPEGGDIVDAVKTFGWGPPEIAQLVAEAKDWQEPAEWRPEAGAEILNNAHKFIRRYVSLSDSQARVAALWAATTHAIDAADYTAYLNVNSAEKESGKTRFLDALKVLAANAWGTENTSTAALVRKVHRGFESGKPVTVLFDERDAQTGADKERAEAIRGILNSGYQRGGCYSRCVGEGANQRVVDYQTFGAKALAGIGSLSDTVASRSVPIRMKRAKRGTVEKFRERRVKREGVAADIASRLASWCTANLERLRGAEPKMPPGLSDRQEDCCEPLLAIADLAGGEWPEAARRAIVELCAQGQAEDDSIGVKLLADIKAIFYPHDEDDNPLDPLDRIASADLAEELGKLEDRPWIEWGKAHKPITPHQVARQLAKYDISPTTVRLDDGRRLNGYKREWFLESWAIYLSPEPSASPVPPNSNRDIVTNRSSSGDGDDFQVVTPTPCHDPENAVSPNVYAGCHDVTDRKGGKGEHDSNTEVAKTPESPESTGVRSKTSWNIGSEEEKAITECLRSGSAGGPAGVSTPLVDGAAWPPEALAAARRFAQASGFQAVWVFDFEFMARPGDRPQPHCLVAHELISGTSIRRFGDELRQLKQAPYPLSTDSLFIAYFAPAELSCHLALNWDLPANVLDLFVEFRNLTNGLPTPAGNGLLGALAYFKLDHMDEAKKEEMQQLASHGGPYTTEERASLVAYCQEDVFALGRLAGVMGPKLDLSQAIRRGRYMKSIALMESNGVPLNTAAFEPLKKNWSRIRLKLIDRLGSQYGVYDSKGVFKEQLFEECLTKNNITDWPRLASGRLDRKNETFERMGLQYPQFELLYQLRVNLDKLRLSELSVGSDGRNRTGLRPFASITGRNQPSNSKFIFGPARFMRYLIHPEPGTGLAYIDCEQQEFGIAAALSGDRAMREAYRSADAYLWFAKRVGAVPHDATKYTHGPIREMYKTTCGLGAMYGMGAKKLALKLGRTEEQARNLLRHLRQVFPAFRRWSDAVVDRAVREGYIQTVYGWRLHVDRNTKRGTILIFPCKRTGPKS